MALFQYQTATSAAQLNEVHRVFWLLKWPFLARQNSVAGQMRFNRAQFQFIKLPNESETGDADNITLYYDYY